MSRKENLLYSLLFFSAGIVGGLLGSGGGVLIVIALKHLIDYKHDRKQIFATSMAIILPMSAISSLIYAKNTDLSLYSVSHYILPACLGGAFGGFLYEKMNFRNLNIIFSLLIIISGIIMLF